MADQLFDLAADTGKRIRAAGKAPYGSADRLAWAAFNLRSAGIGKKIIAELAGSPAGFGSLQATLGAGWDVLEVAAMSLAFEDSMSALDICANALYEATGGPTSASGRFRDVGYWSPTKIAALPAPAVKSWISSLASSSDYADLKIARDALTHRYVSRSIVRRSIPAVSSISAHAHNLGSLDLVIPRMVAFAEGRSAVPSLAISAERG